MKKYYFFILGLLLAVSASGQSISSYVISSTGASLMGSEGALYISMGEPMSTEITEGEVMISQGFLNVSLEGLPTNTDDLLTETIRAYPNPTVAQVVIDLPEMDGTYAYRLFDVAGAVMKSESIQNSKTIVRLQDLASGVYFMQVVKDDKESRTLKIIKE